MRMLCGIFWLTQPLVVHFRPKADILCLGRFVKSAPARKRCHSGPLGACFVKFEGGRAGVELTTLGGGQAVFAHVPYLRSEGRDAQMRVDATGIGSG